MHLGTNEFDSKISIHALRPLVILPDARCYEEGVEVHQTDPHVLSINEESKTIAVHFKGTKNWCGRGDTSYYEAAVKVYSYEEIREHFHGLQVLGAKELIIYPSVKKNAVSLASKSISSKILDLKGP